MCERCKLEQTVKTDNRFGSTSIKLCVNILDSDFTQNMGH